jgi:hypothetical protein
VSSARSQRDPMRYRTPEEEEERERAIAARVAEFLD